MGGGGGLLYWEGGGKDQGPVEGTAGVPNLCGDASWAVTLGSFYGGRREFT